MIIFIIFYKFVSLFSLCIAHIKLNTIHNNKKYENKAYAADFNVSI